MAPGLSEVPLEGRVELLPGERRCAWTRGDGSKLCGAPVTDGPFCEEHDPWFPCAACRGDCLKGEKTCRDTHVLYLALFTPDVLKAGVTRRKRFEERLREQGADAGRVLAVFPDGASARRAETQAPYRKSVSTDEKVEGLHLEPDRKKLGARSKAFGYLGEPFEKRPVQLGPGEPVEGEVIGNKGRLLVVRNDAGLYCVDLRDLLGFELDGDRKPVQSTLEAFSSDRPQR